MNAIVTTPFASPIERLRAGDRKLAGELYCRHARALRQVARELVKNHYDADDAVQEAFVRLIANDPRLPPAPVLIEDWLRAIVRNVCLEQLERRRSAARMQNAGARMRAERREASLAEIDPFHD